MSRLYANENFPFPTVEELRRLGYEVVTIQETGKGGQKISDEEVLSFAVENKMAVLTMNRKHFIRLHHLHPEHQGIIVCTFDPDFISLARRIQASIGLNSTVTGRLIRIMRPAS
ncbi:MAG: DUF5615 family PIN-like protein [Planctomycetes bacterium]|nr:DUF5615 family PIN-like protein [Planctomycetota bacterium]